MTAEGVKAGLPASGGSILTAHRAFVGITGLVENADQSTDAEFEWRWEPTPEGKTFNLVDGPEGPVKASAIFKKYDDGWRLVEIKGD